MQPGRYFYTYYVVVFLVGSISELHHYISTFHKTNLRFEDLQTSSYKYINVVKLFFTRCKKKVKLASNRSKHQGDFREFQGGFMRVLEKYYSGYRDGRELSVSLRFLRNFNKFQRSFIRFFRRFQGLRSIELRGFRRNSTRFQGDSQTLGGFIKFELFSGRRLRPSNLFEIKMFNAQLSEAIF